MPTKKVPRSSALSKGIQKGQELHHPQQSPGSSQKCWLADIEYRAERDLAPKSAKAQINKEAHHEEHLRDAQNRPWHLARLSQRRTAKDRARASKAEKERKKRQDRIDRDLPVPPSPTQSDLDAHDAAARALSAKLKGRTKRSVLEHIIGSGGLHAWKEKTITNHAAQTVPTDYEWTWRQKEFKDEERMADRIDRMVGRMIGEHNAEHKEQLRLDRETWVNQQMRHVQRHDNDASSSIAGSNASSSMAKDTHLISFNKKAWAAGPASKSNIVKIKSKGKKNQFMGGDAVGFDNKMETYRHHSRRYSTGNIQHITNLHKLASDVAAFIDENDDLGSLLRSLSGSLDENIKMNEISKYIKEQNHDDCVDESNRKFRFSCSGSERVNENMSITLFQNYVDKFDNQYSNVEYGEKNTVLEDIMAVEWLNNFLEKSANEVFLTAARRFGPDEYVSPEDLTALRNHVLNDIKQEWALALYLEDTKAGKNNKSLDLEPFKQRFGSSFEKAFMSAVNGNNSHVFAKIARAAANLNSKQVKDGALEASDDHDHDDDNDDKDDDQTEQEDKLYSPDMWDLHEHDISSPSSQGDEPVDTNSDNDDDGTSGANIKEQWQEVLQESLRKVAENMLDSSHHPIAVDERKLRRLWDRDWRLQYTSAFNRAARESLKHKGSNRAHSNPGNIPIITPHSSCKYRPRHHFRRQTDPRLWPRIEPGRDKLHIDAVNKDLAKDTCNLENNSDENERNSNWASANTETSGHIPLNKLMDFDRPPYFDLKKRTRDAPDEYRHEPKRHRPLKIDPQDSYVMGCFWPLADDGEAWSYSRNEIDLEGREDAYDGSVIPVPRLPQQDSEGKKNEGKGIPQNKNRNKRALPLDMTQGEARKDRKSYSEQAKVKQDSIEKQMEENERKAKIFHEEHEKKVKAGWRPNLDNIREIHDPIPGIYNTSQLMGPNVAFDNRTNCMAYDSTTRSRCFGLTPLPLGTSDVTLGLSFGQKTNDTITLNTVKTDENMNNLVEAGELGTNPKVAIPDKIDLMDTHQNTKTAPATIPYFAFSSAVSSSKSPGPLGELDYDNLAKTNLKRTAFDHRPNNAGERSLLGTKPDLEVFENNFKQTNQTTAPNTPLKKHISLVVDNPSSPREGFTSILRELESLQIQDSSKSAHGDSCTENSTRRKTSFPVAQGNLSGLNRAPIVNPNLKSLDEKYQGETVEEPPTTANISTGGLPNDQVPDPVADTSGIAAIAQVRHELDVLNLELQHHGNEKLRIVGSMTPKDMNMLMTRIGKLQDACLNVATDNTAKARRAQINLLKDIKSLEAWMAKLRDAVQEQAEIDVQLAGLF